VRRQPRMERRDRQLRHRRGLQRLPLDEPGLRPRAREPPAELRGGDGVPGQHGRERQHLLLRGEGRGQLGRRHRSLREREPGHEHGREVGQPRHGDGAL
jgi:hypothetical protein